MRQTHLDVRLFLVFLVFFSIISTRLDARIASVQLARVHELDGSPREATDNLEHGRSNHRHGGSRSRQLGGDAPWVVANPIEQDGLQLFLLCESSGGASPRRRRCVDHERDARGGEASRLRSERQHHVVACDVDVQRHNRRASGRAKLELGERRHFILLYTLNLLGSFHGGAR
jgi:hypothetical protein